MRDVFTSPLQDCITRDRGANRRERSLILFAPVVRHNVRSEVISHGMVIGTLAGRAAPARRIICKHTERHQVERDW